MVAKTKDPATESALVPATVGDARQDALLKAIGFDRLSEPERELALNIAQKYELDPLLGHVVLIEGKAYITRDGLLHVAHRSGQFDGIEVTEPLLMDDGQWRCVATVWRKDMSHPFVYSGRYALANRKRGNANYEPEMAIKVAESMALRRAFDVAMATVEERWNDDTTAPETSAPSSLDDAIDAKLAALPASSADTIPTPPTPEVLDQALVAVGAIPSARYASAEAAPQPAGATQTVAVRLPDSEAIATSVPAAITVTAPPPMEREYGTFDGAPRTPKLVPRPDPEIVAPAPEPATALTESVANPMSLEDFKGAIRGIDKEYLKLVAAQMFPDVHGFKDLDPNQLHKLFDEVSSSIEPAPVAPLSEPMSISTSAQLEAICEHRSPFEGNNRCVLPLGHKELHRASDMERWS